jgi:uncharacterized protein YegP (UPF0339 family)
MYFQVWQSKANSQWYWHLRAANHEIVVQSEGYISKQSALHAIGLVKSSSNATVYDA